VLFDLLWRGTPSLLSEEELQLIFTALNRHYQWDEGIEITLEANPDDITEEHLKIWRESGINRLSIGIQSFYDKDLKWMNRAHDAEQSSKCIALAQQYGFENLTVDLIYGSPTTTDERWRSNIERVLDAGINHISSYCLTVEEGTALAHFIKKGRTMPLDQEKAVAQFNLLMDTLEDAGYEHYEISNFARPGFHAIHNTSYWQGVPYIGYGPSAHSYNGVQRQWNIAHNMKYIHAIESGIVPSEYEDLSVVDQYNELVLVRLRTMWGIKIRDVNEEFRNHLLTQAGPLIERGLLVINDDVLKLTRQGKHMADFVSMELMYG
jgi:oxygen-independent coproporphyrinogen-3 oxidase